MRIAIGADHRGVDLKREIVKLLGAAHSVQDFGTYSAGSVDYPDIAGKVARAVAAGEYERGILICDTGIGMCIAANKVKGIRAALCADAFCATRARQHNDANILCLAGVNGRDKLPAILQAFLNTAFEGGRHQRRVEKLRDLEK